MKTIIAGSRTIEDYNLLLEAIKDSDFNITQIISGNCRGIDLMGERYARENNIPLRVISANWDQWGKIAGWKRNEQMAEVADALIAIWLINEKGEGSKGTRNMISIAKRNGLKIYVKEIRQLKVENISDLPLFNNGDKNEEEKR